MLKIVPVVASFWKEFTKRAKYQMSIFLKAQLAQHPGAVLPVRILKKKGYFERK
jgi:hypothetical protein